MFKVLGSTYEQVNQKNTYTYVNTFLGLEKPSSQQHAHPWAAARGASAGGWWGGVGGSAAKPARWQPPAQRRLKAAPGLQPFRVKLLLLTPPSLAGQQGWQLAACNVLCFKYRISLNTNNTNFRRIKVANTGN